jgi:hypothetical protein
MRSARAKVRILKVQSFMQRVREDSEDDDCDAHVEAGAPPPSSVDGAEPPAEAPVQAGAASTSPFSNQDAPVVDGTVNVTSSMRNAKKLWRKATAKATGESRQARAEAGELQHPLLSSANESMGPLPHSTASRTVAERLLTSLTGNLGSGAFIAQASARQAVETQRHPGVWAPKSDLHTTRHMITNSWVNLLLLCLPLGFFAGATNGAPGLVFGANFIALIPLALILGEVTEDLAIRFGDTVGGLLNATFGNIVEMLLSIAALRRGLYTVVATSLLGSILSNLLLVLGGLSLLLLVCLFESLHACFWIVFRKLRRKKEKSGSSHPVLSFFPNNPNPLP